jgi:hypothetical protein
MAIVVLRETRIIINAAGQAEVVVFTRTVMLGGAA